MRIGDNIRKAFHGAGEGIKQGVKDIYHNTRNWSNTTRSASQRLVTFARASMNKNAQIITKVGLSTATTAGFFERKLKDSTERVIGPDIKPDPKATLSEGVTPCCVRPHLPTEFQPLNPLQEGKCREMWEMLKEGKPLPGKEEEFADLEKEFADLLDYAITKRGIKPADLSKEFNDLIGHAGKDGSTRMDLTVKDFEILDYVNFALIKDYFNDDKLLKSLNGDPEMAEARISETLAKSLAYVKNLDGETLKIPTKIDGEYKLVEYEIHQEVLNGELPCYILTPKLTPEIAAGPPPPYVVIRGTEPYLDKGRQGAVASVIADLSKGGVGAEVDFKDLIAKYNENEELAGVKITGHSLGGTLATRLGIELMVQGVEIGVVNAFNATGADNKTAESYKRFKPDPNKFNTFLVEGDIISSAGSKLVGNVRAVELPNAKGKDAGLRHVEHALVGGAQLYEVDVEKENNK